MFRRYYNRFTSADLTVQIIVIAAIILVVAVLLPRIPGVGAGVDCLALPQPVLTGNNQSLLARDADPNDLRLELFLDKTTLATGEPLQMWVRINNASIAPFTLLIVPSEFVFRYTGQEVGLVFSVQSSAGQVLGEPFAARPPVAIRQTYDPTLLRVLGPRSRCNLRVTIDPTRLQTAQVVGGLYRITAVYRNQVRGALAAPVNALTPTPIFPDQGVWVGEVRSNDVLFGVGVSPP
ncbi:MAG: hypothetical protein IT323_01575 [Anaerolineae bacterium]|nr:hypothetical protein [Anaerolineae bacterium]